MLPDSVVAALRAHRTRQRKKRLVAGSRSVDSGHVFATRHGTPYHAAMVTLNTYGHVLEQRQRQVARAMDAVPGG
jgi:hypothetical protein